MRYIRLFAAGIIVLALPCVVAAQTNENVNANTNANTNTAGDSLLEDQLNALLEDPGTLPDNPLFVVKRWWEDVQLFFTFNNEKKAELEQTLALKRIAEAEKLIEKGKVDLAERHLQRYEQHMERFQERIQTLQQNQSDKADELLNRFEMIQGHQQEVLQRVYDQVPEQGKAGIMNAIEQSAKGVQNAIEHVQANSQEKVEAFKNNVEERVKNQKEDVQLEIREQLQERGIIDDNTNEDTGNANENVNATGDDTNSESVQEPESENSNENANDNANDSSDGEHGSENAAN